MKEGTSLTPRQRLKLALVAATAIHAVVIGGVSFSNNKKAIHRTHSIEVVFTPVPTDYEPKDARYAAPLAQAGSGDDARENVPTDVVQGLDPHAEEGLAMAAEFPASSPPAQNADAPLLTQQRAEEAVPVNQKKEKSQGDQLGGDGDFSQAAELARLNAELAMEVRRYAQRPRVSFVNAVSARSSVEAAYMKDWVNRVERVGNLHYPDEARRAQLSGTVLLSVWIDAGGNVVQVQVDRHSGQQVLDDAALRSVQLAAPFARFSPQLARASDQLVITRTWVFEGGGLSTRNDELQTPTASLEADPPTE